MARDRHRHLGDFLLYRQRARVDPALQQARAGTLIEYGLTDRLTAILIRACSTSTSLRRQVPNVPVSTTPSSARATHFSKTRIGWCPARPRLRIPGTTDTANPAAIGYTDFEADFRALLGHNFEVADRPAFFDFELAERWRTDGYPSEFRFEGTLGVKVYPRWMLLAQSFNVVSEGPGISIFGGSYEYYKFELSAVYTLADNWWLQFGGVSTYAGRNALQENGVVLGVWHQF